MGDSSACTAQIGLRPIHSCLVKGVTLMVFLVLIRDPVPAPGAQSTLTNPPSCPRPAFYRLATRVRGAWLPFLKARNKTTRVL